MINSDEIPTAADPGGDYTSAFKPRPPSHLLTSATKTGLSNESQKEESDVDVAVRSMLAEKNDSLNISLMSVAGTNADKNAKNRVIANDIGVGQDIVSRNELDAKKRSEMNRFQSYNLIKTDPVLADMLSNRDFASVAHDDIDKLSTLGKSFQELSWWERRGRWGLYVTPSLSELPKYIADFWGSTDDISTQFQGTKRQTEEGATYFNMIIEDKDETEISHSVKARLSEIQELQPKPVSTVLGGLGYATGQLYSQDWSTLLTTTGLGFMAGGPGGAAIGGSSAVALHTMRIEAGFIYKDLLRSGVPKQTARGIALAAGTVNGLLEIGSTKFAIAPFKDLIKEQVVNRFIKGATEEVSKTTAKQAAKKFGKAYGASVGSELIVEELQEVTAVAAEEIGQIVSDPNFESKFATPEGREQIYNRFYETGVQTLYSQALLPMVGPGMNYGFALRQVAKANKAKEFLGKLSENTKDTKLHGRAPDALYEFVAASASGTSAETIYIEGEELSKVLNQSGLTPAQIDNVLPGVRKQLSELTAGGDVQIPTALFAAKVVGTSLEKPIMSHARLSPEGLSAIKAAELQGRMEQLKKDAQAEMAVQERVNAEFVKEAKEIATQYKAELIAAGRSEEMAEREAILVQAIVVTSAARDRMTPKQWIQKNQLPGVRKAGQQAQEARESVDPSVPESLTEIPTQEEMINELVNDDEFVRSEAQLQLDSLDTDERNGTTLEEQMQFVRNEASGLTIFVDSAKEKISEAQLKLDEELDAVEAAIRAIPHGDDISVTVERAASGSRYVNIERINAKGAPVGNPLVVRLADHPVTQLERHQDADFVSVHAGQTDEFSISPRDAVLKARRFVERRGAIGQSQGPLAQESNSGIDGLELDEQSLEALAEPSPGGSQNMEVAWAEGQRPGEGYWTGSVPHHIRGEFGSWTYENMYKVKREALLNAIITGEGAIPGHTLKARIHIKNEFPNLTGDAGADYETASDNGTLKSYLMQEGGGRIEMPEEGGNFELTSDGFDLTELHEEETEDDTWHTYSYNAEISRYTPDSGVLEQAAVPTSVDAVSNVEASFAHAAESKYKTNREFKLSMQERIQAAAENAGVDITKDTPEADDYLVRVALSDARTALRTNPDAVGWYDTKVRIALGILSLIHPEIKTDPKSRFAFVWALAVTSNGMRVLPNFFLANKVYRYYKANGVMPKKFGLGTSAEQMDASLAIFDRLVGKHGIQAVMDFMLGSMPARETKGFSGKNINGESMSEIVYGSAILGPKIGNGFFQNLYGRFEQLTMDRWFMRTWGRWSGNLVYVNPELVAAKREAIASMIRLCTKDELKEIKSIIGARITISNPDASAKAIYAASTSSKKRIALAKVGPLDESTRKAVVAIVGKPKKDAPHISKGDILRKLGNGLTKNLDGQIEAPGGVLIRQRIRRVMRRVLSEMQKTHPSLTMADLQALLWYPEKRLYDAAKTDVDTEAETGYDSGEAPDYANAAIELAKSEGIADGEIKESIKSSNAETARESDQRLAVSAVERAAGTRPGVAGGEGARGVAEVFPSFKQEQVPATFYSGLSRAISEIETKPLSANAWKERIKGLASKGIVKADEVFWSGLDEWLDLQEGKISREQIQSFLDQNGVHVETVRLNEESRVMLAVREGLATAKVQLQEFDSMTPELEAAFKELNEINDKQDESHGVRDRRVELSQIIDDALDEVSLASLNDRYEDEDRGSGDKFSNYQLPGGENYTETLVTLPLDMNREAELRDVDAKKQIAIIADLDRQIQGTPIRNRNELNRKREIEQRRLDVLLKRQVEQVGRTAYRSDHWNQANVVLHIRSNERTDSDGKKVLFIEEIQSDWGSDVRDAGGFIEPETTTGRTIPSAPFVKTTSSWLNLALKQILLDAVNGGFDKVAFIDGKQSSDRYSLSKYIGKITVKFAEDGTNERMVFLQDHSGKIVDTIAVDEAGLVTHSDKNFGLKDKELHRILGEDVTAKIMAVPLGAPPTEFTDKDLEVGGHGMKDFYDNIVPQAMNKLLKKLGGGKVAETGIQMGDGSVVVQPSIAITPELVSKVQPGLPLFQAAERDNEARGSFDPIKNLIELGAGADFTTVSHELAHWYLLKFMESAGDPNATAATKADADRLLAWFGVAGETFEQRLANWNAMTLEQQRKSHETFAYNWEIYLFTGKAPSVELTGLFEQFKKFVMRAYISIRDDLNAIYKSKFGVDLPFLTEEIRGVFDRMLASEQQISKREAVDNFKAMYQTQEESGMNDAEWAAYQAMVAEANEMAVTDLTKASVRQMEWLSGARARILKRLQAEHKEIRQGVIAEETAKLNNEPIRRAERFLKTGLLTNDAGEEISALEGNKLDRVLVGEMYPTATSGLTPPVDVSKLRGMIGDKGLAPDLVAEMFGFQGGDHLIKKLIELRPAKEVIKERVDARMMSEHGELNTAEQQERAADEALANEARARMVAVEHRFLAKAKTPVAVILQGAKELANSILGRMQIKDIKPRNYSAAEARLAKDKQIAAKAMQSPETARKSAYTREYNSQIAAGVEESVAVAEATVKGNEAAERAQAKIDEHKKQYGDASPEVVAIKKSHQQIIQGQLAKQAYKILREVDRGLAFVRRIISDANRKKMGAEHADQIEAILSRFGLIGVYKPPTSLPTLAEWVAQQQDIGHDIEIPEVAKESNRKHFLELTTDEFRDLMDFVKQIAHMGRTKELVLTAERKVTFDKAKDEIVKAIVENAENRKADSRSASTKFGKTLEAVKMFFVAHIKAAIASQIMDGKYGGPLWNYLIRSANRAGNWETTEVAKATEALTKILAPFFDGGRMGGTGTFFPSIGRSLNREQVLAIVLNLGNESNTQRLLDGEGWTMEQVIPIIRTLTESELLAVQEVWNYFESFKPQIIEKTKRLNGREPAWIEPKPLQVLSADGKAVTLAGGYYPVKYDPRASSRTQSLSAADQAKRALQDAHIASTTRRSYTKQRVKEVHDRPLMLSLVGLYTGVNEVIHDLAWHEWLIDANRLMRSNSFDKAVREKYGVEYKNLFADWIKDIAAGDRGASTAAEMAINFLRQGVSVARLGFKFMTAIGQLTGFAQSVVRVGPGWVGRGLVEFASSPLKSIERVYALSSFMKNRGRTQFREINELRNQVRGESAAKRAVRVGAYFMMLQMQRLVDMSTWMGEYNKQIGLTGDEKLAADLADQSVIDSQGGGMLKDLSAVERGGPIQKLFTVFYGFMNTNLNLSILRGKNEKSYGKQVAQQFMLWVIPSAAMVLLKKALIPDDDEDKWDMKKLSKELAAEQLSFLMGSFFVVREFSETAKILKGGDAYGASADYRGPAGLGVIPDTFVFVKQASQLEFDRAFRKAAINILGSGLGLPSSQINTTIDGIEALVEDETDNPAAVLFGLRRN